MILNKTMEEWKKEYPLLRKLIAMEECFWQNPGMLTFDEADRQAELTMEDMLDAKAKKKKIHLQAPSEHSPNRPQR